MTYDENNNLIQTLEQETATHGRTVYSLDGRNWCRVYWGQPSNNIMCNSSNGNYLQFHTGSADNTDWIEVTGYFSSLNIPNIQIFVGFLRYEKCTNK